MAALVIALLLALAGALLRTDHIPPPSSSNLRQLASRYAHTVPSYCGGRSALCGRVTLYG